MSLAAASAAAAADEKNSFVGGGGEVGRRTVRLSKEGIARLVDNAVRGGGFKNLMTVSVEQTLELEIN